MPFPSCPARSTRRGLAACVRRVADMAAHCYFTDQTRQLLSGHLGFVRQGQGGAVSMVIVGGRLVAGDDDITERTLLVRATF